MAIDPVCKMSVEPETAAAKIDHQGTIYYFCAVGCQKAFMAEPEKYLKGSDTSGQSTGSAGRHD